MGAWLCCIKWLGVKVERRWFFLVPFQKAKPLQAEFFSLQRFAIRGLA